MLTDLIAEQLNINNLKLDRFQDIVTRLFAWGIIIRSEDGAEQRAYDDARRVENLLTEYFGVAGFRLLHDRKAEFFRLYAPGAVIPGVSIDESSEPVPTLRAKVSPDFVAAALALRFLYQQGLTSGGSRLADTGDVLIGFEDLASTMLSQLKRALPDGVVERRNLLTELKRHRLVNFNASFSPTDEEAIIAIRPTILTIVGEDALAAVIDDEVDANEPGEPRAEKTPQSLHAAANDGHP
jgi:hypothetical protein